MISKIPSLYLLSKNEVAVVSMEMHETGSPPRAELDFTTMKHSCSVWGQWGTPELANNRRGWVPEKGGFAGCC